MKKYFLILLVAVAIHTSAQQVGLSFSYFVPRNGSFSIPVSPFSIRGLGYDFSRFLAIQTGASLYRMGGLSIINVPFVSKKPMTGPNFTIMVPGELVLKFPGRKAEFDVKGGAFAFYSLWQKLNVGNIDRAIRTSENWTLANSDLSFQNKPGFGYMVGVELSFDVTRQWGLSFEINYLLGSSKIPLSGIANGLDNSGSLVSKTIDEPNAKVDFSGLEFSIGINIGG